LTCLSSGPGVGTALSEEQQAVVEAVGRFAENENRPVAGEYDREGKYPHEVMGKAAEMGLPGAHFPVEYGGAGCPTLEMALITEELFAVDPGIGLCVSSAGFGAKGLLEFGTENQKERFRPPITSGESVMGAAISEPRDGSDVTGYRHACREGRRRVGRDREQDVDHERERRRLLRRHV
jgi:alkylation response protein AidB-like acyl-CoA dehydrogenase